MSFNFIKLSLINKLLIIFSFLLLFLWLIPNMVNYYENLNQYNSKKSSLKEVNLKHGVTKEAQKFNSKLFKSEVSTLFKEVLVVSMSEGKHHVAVQLEKDKIKTFNSFIESLALHYFVSIENNELKFEEKNKILEVTFTLKEF